MYSCCTIKIELLLHFLCLLKVYYKERTIHKYKYVCMIVEFHKCRMYCRDYIIVERIVSFHFNFCLVFYLQKIELVNSMKNDFGIQIEN